MEKENLSKLSFFLVVIFVTGYIVKIFYKKKNENFTHINYDPTDNKEYEINGDKYADYGYVFKIPESKQRPKKNLIKGDEDIFKNRIEDQDYIKEDPKKYLKDYSDKIEKPIKIPNKFINEFDKENDKVCNKNRFNNYGELFQKSSGNNPPCYESMNSCNESDNISVNRFDREYFNFDKKTKYCKSKLPNNILHDRKTFYENNRGKTIRQVYDKLVENDYNKNIKRPVDTTKLIVGDNNCKLFSKDMWCYENEKSSNGGELFNGLYANDPYTSKNLVLSE